MPSFVEEALKEKGLKADYKNRPAYQQNDYIGWINQAKRQETKIKRLSQMLHELEVGGVYMKMSHAISSKNWCDHFLINQAQGAELLDFTARQI